MIGPDEIERLFILRGVGPFQALEDIELLLIAQHARRRSYAAGQTILPAGAIADLLVVRAGGEARVAGREAPPVFDAAGLLFGLAAEAEFVAGPDGLDALVIAKPHVFTIARECPEFVVGLRTLMTTETGR